MASRGLGAQLVRATFGGAAVSVVGMGFTFLAGIQLARGLGVEGYGIYGIAMAAVALVGVPSQFGIPQLFMREVAATSGMERWGELKGVVRWSLRRILMNTSIVAGLLVLYTVTIGPGVRSALGGALVVGSLMVPLVALAALAGGGLRGLMHNVAGQLPDYLIRPAAFSAILGLVFVTGIAFTPQVAMAAGVASALVAVGCGGLLFYRRFPREAAGQDAVETPATWRRAAFPMALAEGMRVVEGHAAVLALGALASVSEVGLFRVAVSVMAVLGLPITVFNLVASPAIARLHATGDRARLARMTGLVAGGMTLSVLALVLPLALFGDVLIGFFFGEEFAPANTILLVLAIGSLGNAMLGVGASFLNMVGLQQRVTRASAISVIVLCTALLALIPPFGAIGAASAVTGAMIVWSALTWQDVRRLTGCDVSLGGLVRKADI